MAAKPVSHPVQNAVHHAPSATICRRLGDELPTLWNASDLPTSERARTKRAAKYRKEAPKLADWLDDSVAEGLAVHALSKRWRRRLRMSNPIDRTVNRDPKRHAVKVRVFPDVKPLLRLVAAITVETGEK